MRSVADLAADTLLPACWLLGGKGFLGEAMCGVGHSLLGHLERVGAEEM